MLSKRIHYCWFGESDMPENYKSFIAEWEKLHPDWIIKRWDESNSPMSLPYIKTAIEHNNWANISNYVRFYALRQEGGIYLDTDMKVLQPMDILLTNNCFLGFESGNAGSGEFWVNNAIMGAEAGHPFIVECEQYLLEQFDGTEQANLSSPQLVTAVLKTRHGLKEYGRQQLGDIMLYEKEVFYPIPVDKAYLLKETDKYPKETIAVHMWGRTWFTNEMLIEEMDNLRRYTHELNDFIEIIKNDLKQSREDLHTVELENAELKTMIKESLQKIETSQLEMGKSTIESDKKISEISMQLKILAEQQEYLVQKFGRKGNRESLWSIAKRKLFK